MATGFASLLPQTNTQLSPEEQRIASLQDMFRGVVQQSKADEAALQRQLLERQQAQENQGFLGSLLQGITSPLRTVGEGVRSFGALSSGQPINQQEFNLGSLLTDQELQRAVENPEQALLQETAKAGSFLLPSLSGLGSIQGAAASGALQGFGEAENLQDLGGTLQSIGTGALIGGATQGIFDKVLPLAGRALKGIGSRLDDVAGSRELAAIRTAVGKSPTGKLRGSLPKIANAAKAYNITINNADDVARLSSNIFDDLGGVIAGRSDELTNAGVAIDINDVIKPLRDKLDDTLTSDLRRPLERVINSIESTAPDGTITPSQLYQLKQEFGRLGKFNPNAVGEAKTAAELFETAYGSASDELDRVFRAAGYDDLGDINELLEAAIKGEQWIKQASNAAPAQTFSDLTQDSAILGAIVSGSPMGAMVGAGANRLINSPAGERALGGLLSRIGQGATAGGDILSQIGGDIGVLPAVAASAGLQQTTEVQQPQELQAVEGELIQQIDQRTDPLFWSGQGLKITDAIRLADFYSQQQGGGDGTPLSQKERSLVSEANQAVSELDRLLRKDSNLLLQTATTPTFLQGTDAQRVNATRTAIEEAIGRLNSGGAITDDEAARFQSFVPQFGDTPENIQAKINTLRSRFQSLL